MSHNYNKQDENNKTGKAFTDSSQKHAVLTTAKTIDKKPDTISLELIYEELPDHCIQFFFLS